MPRSAVYGLSSSTREEPSALAQDAAFYLQLQPRQLPSRLLYDALGSALFDAICLLPWYRITRGELRLLQRYAATIGEVLREGGRIVELGCGNGEKLATLVTHAEVAAAVLGMLAMPGLTAADIDLSAGMVAR